MIKWKKKPCVKCPYKLGVVTTPFNPCTECRLNGYKTYEWFLKLPWQGKIPKSRDKLDIGWDKGMDEEYKKALERVEILERCRESGRK